MKHTNPPPWSQRFIYLRDLLRELVVRDMKVRYKRSLLGIAWSLLNPLAQLMVFNFLFRSVLPLNIPDYPLFVFSGLLSWIWFQSSLIMATGAITDNRELIRQPGFPAAILPVVVVTTNLIHFLLALPVLLAFLLFSGTGLSLTLVALPAVIGIQFLLTVSLAYLTATCHVFFRDTQHLLSLLLLLLFYLTPVFYDVSAVPDPYWQYYGINPLVHLLEAYRAILLRGALPDSPLLILIGALAGALLWVNASIFLRVKYRFAEEL